MGNPVGGHDGPLVGRAAERDQLERALDAVLNGSSAAVAIVGEPGIGKSRLLAHLTDRAKGATPEIFVGSGSELEPEIPFGLAVTALDARVATLDPDARHRLGPGRLAELATVFPSLTAAPPHASGPHHVEPFRCYYAIGRLLDELSGQRPVVLAFDDVHWADQASLELVAYLLRQPVAGCLLALAFRRQAPDLLLRSVGRASLEGRLHCMELGPLSREESAELIDDRFTAEAHEALHIESGGNPFYLDQLARTSDQLGRLLFTDVDAAVADGVPAAVRASIKQQLRQLTMQAQRFAQAASVAGAPFELDLTADIGGFDRDLAVKLLDELIAADVVRPGRIPGTWSFRHPIVRLAVYQTAGHAWRMRAHRRAADVLARRGAPLPERAKHVVRAGAAREDWEAIDLLVGAGESVASRAPATAAHWLSEAARLLPDTARRRVSVLVALATALAAAGRMKDARPLLSEALDHAVTGQDLERRHQIAVMLSRVELALGRGDAACKVLAEVHATAPPNSRDASMIAIELAKGLAFLRRWDEAIATASEVVALGSALDPVLRTSALAARALFCSSTLGPTFSAALSDLDVAAADLDALADDDLTPERLDTLRYVLRAELYQERLEAAAAHAMRGASVCRARGHWLRYVEFLQSLLIIDLWRGRLPEARRTAEVLEEAARLFDNDAIASQVQSGLCLLASFEGDSTAAFAAAERALSAADRTPHSGFAWMAHLYYGRALADAGQYELARRHILAACGPELNDVPPSMRPQWHRLLAEAEVARGRLDEAERFAHLVERAAEACGAGARSGEARCARAAILLARGKPLDAAALAVAGAEALHTSGLKIEAARGRLFAAHAFLQVEDKAAAIEQFVAAHELLHSCGAVRLAEAAARELRSLGHRLAPRHTRRPDGGAASVLSRREREVAALAVRGLTNRQIAEELFISRKTVETHLAHVFAKLGVSSRAAVAAALRSARG